MCKTLFKCLRNPIKSTRVSQDLTIANCFTVHKTSERTVSLQTLIARELSADSAGIYKIMVLYSVSELGTIFIVN